MYVSQEFQSCPGLHDRFPSLLRDVGDWGESRELG
jgi:hypothetical protein